MVYSQQKSHKKTLPADDINQFAMFATGELSSYITKPSDVSWQANANYSKNDPKWFVNSDGNYIGTGHYSNEWLNNRLWLPSIYEVYDKDIASDSTETAFTADGGLWGLTEQELSNSAHTWLRSCHPTDYKSIFHLMSDGKDLVCAYPYSFYAMRPALHLNLSAVEESIKPKPFDVTYGSTTTSYATIEEAWAAANTMSSAKVTMNADATVSQTLVVDSGKNITLEPNKYVLALAETAIGSVIRVEGVFTAKHNSTEWAEYTIKNPVTGADVTLSGGFITGGKGTQVGSYTFGGGVYVAEGGKFTLDNCPIAGNRADYGGGVYVASNATFVMKNNVAEILCNEGEMGGGLYVCADATTNLGAGTGIGYNKALDGGGIFIEGGSVTLSTLESFYTYIYENASTSSGGGVYINGGTMSGKASISENTANNGGGVYIFDGTFGFSGGKIADNTITSGDGGGVYTGSKTTAAFKICGAPKISGNKKGSSANNVYLGSGKEITVTDTITAGAKIYINNKGSVVKGFTQDGDPTNYFHADDPTNNCIYVGDKTTGAVVIGTHSGGTANCVDKAVCTGCKKEYGNINGSNHKTVVTDEAKAATCTETGLTEGSHCSACNTVIVARQTIAEKGHTEGTAATCTKKAVCATCNKEYGEELGHDLFLVIAEPPQKSYSAFDRLITSDMVVNVGCRRVGCGHKQEIEQGDYTITYDNGKFLHVGDTSVTISYAVAPNKTITAVVDGLSVAAKRANVVWQYNLTPDDGTAWANITADTQFTYDPDRRYAVRATFRDGTGVMRTFREFDAPISFKIDGKTASSVGNVGAYEFTLDTSAELYTDYSSADYSFIGTTANFKINRAPIELNDTNNFYWLMQTDGDTSSALRDGYVKLIDGGNGESYYKYFSEAGDGRDRVIRSIVRDRNKAITIKLFGARSGDGVYSIAYGESGELADGGYTQSASGKYTAYAVLTIANDNYEFIKTGELEADRHMTAQIREDGSVLISKQWYIAKIDNGLLSQQQGGTYGKEWSISGWNYGGEVNNFAPRLEHGDPGAYNGVIDFTTEQYADDELVTFELFGVETTGTVNRVKLGDTFNRHDFDSYINSSVPVGKYVLVVHAGAYTSIEHEHWFDGTNHDGAAAGIFYDGFTREFNFTVTSATLCANVAELNGKTFEYDYDGKLHLFDDSFTLGAPVSERVGIWANTEFDKYYGNAELYYNLDRWSDTDNFISFSALNAIQNASGKPVNADTYTVRFIVRAPNYTDVKGDGAVGYSFTVKINKAVLKAPDNVTDTLMRKYVFSLPENALYGVKSGVVTTFTQAGEYNIVLKPIDADNYAWAAGDNVRGDEATITLTLVLHDHVYGDWHDEIAATCTTTGTKGYKDCSICEKHFDFGGTEITDLTVAATGHTAVVDAAKSSTCTETGLTEGEHCSVCGAILTAQQEIAAIGHSFGDWTVYREATVDEFGEQRRVCAHDAAHFETRQTEKRIAMLVKSDENGGDNKVIVTAPNGFEHDIRLVVTEVARENYAQFEAIAQAVSGKVDFVYDVTLKSDGVTVQPDGMITIKLLIPTELRGKSFKLFHMHDGTATDIEYSAEGYYAVVNVDKLSEFIFVGEKIAPEPDPVDPIWSILIVILSLIVAGEIGYIAYRKIRKNKTTDSKE